MPEPAHLAGATDVPLLEETIGANLDAHHRPLRRARRAGRRRSRTCASPTTQLGDEVDRVARGLMARGLGVGDRVGIWSPNSAAWVLVQYATAKMGAILVTINPAYRTHEVQYALAQSGCRMLVAATDFKTSDYRAMVAEVRGDLPGLEHVVFLGTPDWDDLLAAADEVSDERPGRAGRIAVGDRPDQHPVHERHDRASRRAPRSATATSSTTASSSARAAATPSRTASASPCPSTTASGWSSATWPAPRTAPPSSSRPRPSTRSPPWRRWPPSAAPASTACRRCSSPSWRCPTSTASTCRACAPGSWPGSPCPVEVMKQCVSVMHMDEVTICYGMTETSPVSTQTAADDPIDKRVGTVGRVHPHVEVKVVAPDGGATAGAGRDGRAVHPRATR